MSPLEDCCATCLGCGRTYCRDEQPSPGDAELCPDCWDIEDPEDAA